jgi:5-methyltetrahydropteroyltriglutamate--homocysteine methyltransferase
MLGTTAEEKEDSMAVRTTVVGSWWWPEEHADELARYHAGELEPAEGEALLDRCAAAAISEQRELGLDEWTGGEFNTYNFLNHLQHRLTGIEVDSHGTHEMFDYDDLAHARIVGEIEAPTGLGYVEAYVRENRLPGGVNKAAVVSPLEVAAHEADQPEERDSQMSNLIRIVNAEARALADAGCQHVQLDAPIIGINLNMDRMTLDAAVEMIAGCLEGVEATRGIHICNGNLKGRPASAILRNATWIPLLQRLEGIVDVANLECSYFSEWAERDAFRDLPASMQLAAGIVDEANYWVEPVSKIRSRAADWARVVGEERLWLSPSCGFGRHPGRDTPVLRAKLENMVEAAATL